jgi:hypothetical protein
MVHPRIHPKRLAIFRGNHTETKIMFKISRIVAALTAATAVMAVQAGEVEVLRQGPYLERFCCGRWRR